MPIVLAILSLAQGLQQMKSGDKVGGAMSMFGAGRSFGQLVNNFSVGSTPYVADGVRRNFL